MLRYFISDRVLRTEEIGHKMFQYIVLWTKLVFCSNIAYVGLILGINRERNIVGVVEINSRNKKENGTEKGKRNCCWLG
jgi:hypothetical protein